MPKVKGKAPKHLRPYLFHGLELSWSDDDDNAMGDCPFCETEGKFGVKLSNGQYNCFHGCTGNVTTFLRWLWEKSDAKTNDYSELAESRGLLPETLMQWGVAKSILRPSWLVPGYNVKGEINQLYRYVRLHTGKYSLLATPKYVGEDSEKIGHQLFGVNLFDKKKPETFICEGPWDAMSLWEMLRQTKQTDDGLRATANVEGSLLAEANVLGVPGCNVWVPRWGTLLDGKVVNFMFDNDHPRESATGKSLSPVSLLGTERAVGILNSATHPPVEINYLRWGRQGYDVTLPNGYDIRDALVLPSLPKVAGNGARRGLGGDPAQTDARRGLEARLTALQALLGNLVPIPQAWLRSAPTASDENNTADRGLECAPCTEYSQLVIAWRKALKWTAGLDHALVVMLASIASTKMIGDQLWIKVIGPAACGKSTLCEALSVNKQHVLAKSTIRGFHSGYKTKGQENQDNSLIALLPGKTLVIKDGDTLLQSPNLPQILSEGRDIYDCVSRTHYRNEKSQDYVGIRMTWILCGTSSLRSIDSSELGERFLDCVIMDGINDDLEDEIIWRVANRASRSVTLETDGEAATQYELELVEAMQLTGGYIDYLRENAAKAIAKIASPRQALLYCARLGKFVAYMRARPSVRQEETAEREFATRLVSQLVRLAKCSAFVLNRRTLDEPVMNCVTRVAMDTARGQTLGITQYLYDVGEKGAESRAVSMFSKHTTEERARSLLRFLRQIGVVEMTQPGSSGIRSKQRWKLTARVRELYRGILDGASF